jgi:hypothetical protein
VSSIYGLSWLGGIVLVGRLVGFVWVRIAHRMGSYGTP